jgi:signal transduction histidine kinase
MAARAPEHASIQHREHGTRIKAVVCLIANCTHQHRDKHGGADAFARDVANHDEQTAIRLHEGLKEVAADSLGRMIFGFNGKETRDKCLRNQHALLQLLCLFQIPGDGLTRQFLIYLRTEKAAHNQCTDDQHHEKPGGGRDCDTKAENENDRGNPEGIQDIDPEAGNLDQQQGQCGQQRLGAVAAETFDDPLDAVMNLIYLARQEPGDGRRDQYLEAADKELRRVAHLTAQSLRFYKQSSKPQAVRPVDLICSVLDVYGSQIANGGIALEQRDRTSEAIVCFESEIRQVFSNLIRNAVDAMKGKPGRLFVRSREATNWKTNTRGVLITVADTGAGIDPKSMAKIYTAFYTTKGINGTGLGLWVSNEIVQRHNGRLRVRSRRTGSESGTVFTFFLPYQSTTT